MSFGIEMTAQGVFVGSRQEHFVVCLIDVPDFEKAGASVIPAAVAGIATFGSKGLRGEAMTFPLQPIGFSREQRGFFAAFRTEFSNQSLIHDDSKGGGNLVVGETEIPEGRHCADGVARVERRENDMSGDRCRHRCVYRSGGGSL